MPIPAFAAITQRGNTWATTTNTDLTINKPGGVVAGDVMIVNIAKVGNNTTAPSSTGWTLIDGRNLGGMTARYGAVLYKVASASEPVSYTFALGAGTTGAVGSIVAFYNVDTSGATPFDVAPGTISVQPSQTAVVATTITTASANAAVIMFGMAANSAPTWNDGAWNTTSPGPLTELYDYQLAAAGSVGAAWATKATAGATGAGAATLSAPQRNGGILIALKPLTPTALNVNAATGTYGGTTSLTATLSPAVAGKTISFTLNGAAVGTAVTNGSGVANIPAASLAGINAGSYPSGAGASFGGDTGYEASSGTASLTVNKATPTITWPDPADIVYGTALSSTQLCATASVPGTFVYSPDFGALLPAGNGQTLHVDFTPTDTANYNTASGDVAINVNMATLTITADDAPKTYGDMLTFAGTEFHAVGLVNADTVTSVTLTSAGADALAAIGDYDIVPSAALGTGLSNYNITYVNGTLAVRRNLTIIANSRDKIYGDTLTFVGTEFTAIGLDGSDTITSVTLTSSGAGAAAAAGTHDILPSAASGTGLSNYRITYVNGTLTVNPKALTITADSRSKTYGTTATFAGTEFTTDGLVNGDIVTSVTLTSDGAAAGATAEGSPYTIMPSAAIGTGLSNYNITYVNGSLTVNKATIGLSVSCSASKSTYGQSVTFTATVTDAAATGTVTFEDGGTTLGSRTLSNGTATFTSSTLSIGSHFITAAYSGDANFAGNTSTAVDITIRAAAGANWGLIGGIIAAEVLVGLLELLLILRRRRKRKQRARAQSNATPE